MYEGVLVDYCWHCNTKDVPCYQYTNDEGIPEAICRQCLLNFVAEIDEYTRHLEPAEGE